MGGMLGNQVPPDQIFEPTLKTVPTVDQPHEGKSVHVNSYKVLVFISVPQLALHSICENCTMYMETNAVCGSAGNEAIIHCVLLNLHA